MILMIPEPRLGMGTWGMGGKYKRDENTIEQSVEVLQLGLSLGLRVIDTAELYGAGLSEIIVGKAIRSKPRESSYVISKVWRTNLAYDDVLRAAEGSLKRLDTPYIDLYLVHHPNPFVPISDTLRAMERLLEEGVVKAIGVSNFSVTQMEEAGNALKHEKLSANEIEYNITKQQARRDVLPYCKTHGIEVISCSPLARGLATHNSSIATLARTYGVTENQIALRWLMEEGTIPIPATLDPEHLRENIEVLNFTLAPEDRNTLCIN